MSCDFMFRLSLPVSVVDRYRSASNPRTYLISKNRDADLGPLVTTPSLRSPQKGLKTSDVP
jgi:hypothetical protein